MLRRLPSVDEVLRTERAAALAQEYEHAVLVNAARRVLEEMRERLAQEASAAPLEDTSADAVAANVAARLEREFGPTLRHAVNATGVILHTGLGRALLPSAAVRAIQNAISGYCTLAIDLETGRRGHRDTHLSNLLCELTGAEAATVVNNNAAATMLILNTLAKGREVIVSRGQLVEIGGSFRMPEVMESSGALLREVGTTNKTHLRDYAAAIGDNTAAIMRVHHSNYRILGFASEPGLPELVELANQHGLPVIDDLGSGALVDLTWYGLPQEPMAQDSMKAGAAVACFSGDKLIGGPQAGVIVGKADIVERVKKNPLARALRVDKMTVAGMAATLRLFLNRDALAREHPTYCMLSLPLEELRSRAQAVAERVRQVLANKAEIAVTEGGTEVGSGSVPTETVPTMLLSVKPVAIPAETLAKRLRLNDPPVCARVHHETVLFDFRTIQPDEDAVVAAAVAEALAGEEA